MTGILNQSGLRPRFDGPKLMHDGRQPFKLMQRKIGFAPFYKSPVPRLHTNIRPDVLIGIQINLFGLEHQWPEHTVKLPDPVHGLNT